MKKMIFGVIAPIASMFSILVTPLEMSANCYDPQPCCDPCDECCDDGWMQYIGLALVAAGAGALAGWGVAESTNNKGSHGRTGATGPIGPIGGFKVLNPADTLTATAPAFGLDPQQGSGTLTPFVSLPDGLVLTGNPVTVTFSMGSLSWPIVPAGDVVEGTYEYGVLFTSTDPVDALVFAGTSAIFPVVTSTATGVSTTLTAISIPFLSLNSGKQAQFGTDYTYDTAFP
jgi:hypothetical protein